MGKVKIAAATGSAATGRKGVGLRVQAAMSAAIDQAYKDGLAGNPEAIRARMQAAREKVKAEG